MKKLAFLLLIAGTFAMASCNTKSCRCYERHSDRWTGPVTYSTYVGTPCGDLNTPTVLCNEMEDHILNPDDIAVGKKK